MGKKKDAADKGEKKLRIPKHVAGVKVPKELRQRGEALIAQAQSPAGQAVIAQGVSIVAALAASAAKAAAQSAASRSAAAEGQAPSPAPAARPEAAANDPAAPAPGEAMAKAVTAGIDAALGRLFAKR